MTAITNQSQRSLRNGHSDRLFYKSDNPNSYTCPLDHLKLVQVFGNSVRVFVNDVTQYPWLEDVSSRTAYKEDSD